MVNLYLRNHQFRDSLVHKHATELDMKAMAIRLSAIDRAASSVSPMYIVTDLSIGVQRSLSLPRLFYQVPNLPRLDLRKLIIKRPLELEIERTLLKHETKSYHETLEHRLRHIRVGGNVSRQLIDLRRLELFNRVVSGVELRSPGLFGDGKELVPRDFVANDLRILAPSRLSKQSGDKVADVEAVSESDWNFARAWDAGGLVGNINSHGNTTKVKLDVGDDEVVQEETIVDSRVLERCRFKSLQVLNLDGVRWEDGG